MGLKLNVVNWYNAVLELVRMSLGTSDGEFEFNKLTEEDWENLSEEVFSQTIGLMCFDAVSSVKSCMPESVYQKWFKRSLSLTAKWVGNFNGQIKLVDLLNKNNIPYVILKGMSSAYYYPDNEKRASGDVDFIVRPEDVEKTRRLICDEWGIELNNVNPIHYEFDFEKVRFELHKCVSGLPDNKVKIFFQEELSDIVEEGETTEQGFLKPCDYHHGIVILLHTMHHMFANGIGARQLCDWACFVKETHEQSFWQDKMLPLLEKTGTITFAKALTEACIYYLNIPAPSWHSSVSDELRDSVITEIYTSGNFGRKNPNNNSRMNLMVVKNSKKLTVFRKIRKMIKALHNSNKIVFPILNKAPYLYPFIMIYRVFRHIVLMIRGERPSLLEVSRQADERNKVFMKYNLYETEE